MAQPFTQAQSGDELARQQGYGSVDEMMADIDRSLGGSSFTEGLAARRAKLEQLTGRTNAVQEFQQGEGAQNLAAIEGSQRLPGEAPSDIIKSAMGVRGTGRQILSNAASNEVSGLNALTDLLQVAIGAKKQIDENKKSATYTIDATDWSEQDKQLANLSGYDAVAAVRKQGGDQFLKGDAKDRIATAEAILQSGGVKRWRKQLPVDQLMSDTERKDMDVQVDLQMQIEAAKQLLADAKDISAASGPLAQILPNFVVGKDNREIRRAIETVKAQYAKMLSGATISDSEIKRLKQFLPDVSKTEAQNLEDLKKLSRDISINQKIFELGKQNGLTPNQAFSQFGKDVFNEFGVSDAITPSKEFDREAAKKAGYTDEEIDAYLGGK